MLSGVLRPYQAGFARLRTSFAHARCSGLPTAASKLTPLPHISLARRLRTGFNVPSSSQPLHRDCRAFRRINSEEGNCTSVVPHRLRRKRLGGGYLLANAAKGHTRYDSSANVTRENDHSSTLDSAHSYINVPPHMRDYYYFAVTTQQPYSCDNH
ncbi:hypothetical protein KSP39_PZI003894 [Platanthera zijinensis]|uniref:Uncharacterized protein n=1 Tax=Platanthera zijinensis TaxID=2320716 RepID=A0AAP0BTG4_9ASPA